MRSLSPLGERFLTEFKDTGIAYIAYPGKNALGYLTNQWMQPFCANRIPTVSSTLSA